MLFPDVALQGAWCAGPKAGVADSGCSVQAGGVGSRNIPTWSHDRPLGAGCQDLVVATQETTQPVSVLVGGALLAS